MTGTVTLSFSSVSIHVQGMTRESADRMLEEWRPFVTHATGEPFLSLQVSFVDGDVDPGPFRPQLMSSTFEPDAARFSMNGGEVRVDETGQAQVTLTRGLGPKEYFTLMNLLRAALAWRLPQRGAALLHAAGIVLGQTAFLLVGSEGSGKSTWAALAERVGARVLSDDLVLVDGGGARLDALGSPFRSTHRADYRPGRWPVSAILFPRHGASPAWTACDGMLARARIAANLPFVSSALERDPRVAAVVERLATAVPCRELTFGLDPDFVALLRSTMR